MYDSGWNVIEFAQDYLCADEHQPEFRHAARDIDE